MNTQAEAMNPFANSFRASLAMSLYVMMIYLSTGAVGTLQIWLRQQGLQRIVSGSLLAIFIGLVVYLVAVKLRRRGFADVMTLVGSGLVYAYLIKNYAKAPSDWIHLIEYPPLAVISYYAIKFSLRGWMAFAVALGLTATVGAGDELLQIYTPARTADVHDLIVNVIASAVALAVVWIVIERNDGIAEG